MHKMGTFTLICHKTAARNTNLRQEFYRIIYKSLSINYLKYDPDVAFDRGYLYQLGQAVALRRQRQHRQRQKMTLTIC